jgi:hypothetical protein
LAVDQWIPRVTEAGLRTVAMVTPVFYFNRVAVESVGQKLDPDRLIMQNFRQPRGCAGMALVLPAESKLTRVPKRDPLTCVSPKG